jgi:hypothetical protein
MHWYGYSEKVYKVKEKVVLAKQNITYVRFCTSYDNKEWERVVELGEELDRLGAPEEVYPRKDRVVLATCLINAQKNIDNSNHIEAEKVLKRANELRPDDPNILYNLGTAYSLCANEGETPTP